MISEAYLRSCQTSMMKFFAKMDSIPACNYMFKVINKNARTRREICSKFKDTRTTQERRHWRRPGVFIVNFEHISLLVLVFLLLTLSR